MSIKYTVEENKLKTGTYYARPVQLSVRDMDRLIRDISDETTISPPDVAAVLKGFIKEVVQGIVDGDRVSMDDFVDFKPRLNQVLSSAADVFDPAAGGRLSVAATIKRQLTKQIRSQVSFEKIVADQKKPLPKTMYDANRMQVGVYTPGSIGQLDGKNLKLRDPAAADQGVFFVDPNSGSQVKAVEYQNNGDRKLVFLVPVNLSGERRVEVRTRYTPSGDLRVGVLKNTVTAA